MIQNYMSVAILVSFPEALLVLLIGLNLSNVRKINISKLLIVATIQSIIALFVRMSNIYLGVHTIILAISLCVLIIIFFKIVYYKAIIPVLIGILSQGLLQSIVLPIIKSVFNVEITNLYYNPENLIICSIPIFVVSLILLIIIKNSRFYLCDIGG